MSFLMIIGICLVIFGVLFLLGRSAGGSVQLLSRFSVTVRRFYYAIAASAVMTAAALFLVGSTDDKPMLMLRLFIVSALALPLLINARLRQEKTGSGAYLQLLILLAAALYFLLMGDAKGHAFVLRNSIWVFCSYLLILLFPFIGKGEEEDAWLLDQAHLQAFLIGFVWAFVLFLGLVAALAGMDYLLAVKIPSDFYLRLWIVMAGFVGVLVYLSALPPDLTTLRQDVIRPRMLDGFIRNVLVPLVVIYLFILYAYAAKIILKGSWPKGGVAGFILGFCGVGILTYMLLKPVDSERSARHVGLFRRFFFPLVLPLTVMLFLSVWRRVTEYGVTEIRYFGMASAFWLASVALYFTVSRKKDFRVLPASIVLISLVVSFGPWGALSVSAASQTERLRHMLEKAGLLLNGQLQNIKDAPSGKELVQINQTIKYLHNIGRTDQLVKWSGGKISLDNQPKDIAAKLGIRYELYDVRNNSNYFSFQSIAASENNAFMTHGYRYFWQISLFGQTAARNVRLDDKLAPLLVNLKDNGRHITVSSAGRQIADFDLGSLVNRLISEGPNSGQIPQEKLVLVSENKEVRLVITNINGSMKDGKPVSSFLSGFLFYGR